MPIGQHVEVKECDTTKLEDIFKALVSLHTGGFFHGDARLGNLLFFGGDGYKWIDLMLGRSDVAAPSQFQNDVKVLCCSILRSTLQWN